MSAAPLAAALPLTTAPPHTQMPWEDPPKPRAIDVASMSDVIVRMESANSAKGES